VFLSLIVYLTFRLLVSFILRKLDERKWSSRKTPVVEKRSVYVEAGSIGCDFATNQVYLPVYYGGVELRIPLSLEMLGGMNLLNKTAPPAKELQLSMSMYHEANLLPKGVVYIYDGEEVKGMGTRMVIGRSTFLVTALHVLKGCMGEVSIGNGRVRIPFNRTDVNIVPVDGLDLCVVAVPPGLWSSAGITAVKSKTATVGSVVNMFGDVNGKLAFTTGAIASLSKSKGLHLASSKPGWSGTPLLCEGAVVGIHVGHNGSKNEFVRTNEIVTILSFLFSESPLGNFGSKAITYDEMMENYDESDYELIKIGGVPVALADHNFAVDTLRAQESKFKMRSWFEMTEMESDLPDFLESASNLNGLSPRKGAPQESTQWEGLDYKKQPAKALSLILDNIDSTTDRRVAEACLSAIVGRQRLSSGEPSKEAPRDSNKPSPNSQNSVTGDGPKSARRRRKRVSSSKPLGSSEPKDQAIGLQQSTKSASYTPPHKRVLPVEPSTEKNLNLKSGSTSGTQ